MTKASPDAQPLCSGSPLWTWIHCCSSSTRQAGDLEASCLLHYYLHVLIKHWMIYTPMRITLIAELINVPLGDGERPPDLLRISSASKIRYERQIPDRRQIYLSNFYTHQSFWPRQNLERLFLLPWQRLGSRSLRRSREITHFSAVSSRKSTKRSYLIFI